VEIYSRYYLFCD